MSRREKAKCRHCGDCFTGDKCLNCRSYRYPYNECGGYMQPLTEKCDHYGRGLTGKNNAFPLFHVQKGVP